MSHFMWDCTALLSIVSLSHLFRPCPAFWLALDFEKLNHSGTDASLKSGFHPMFGMKAGGRLRLMSVELCTSGSSAGLPLTVFAILLHPTGGNILSLHNISSCRLKWKMMESTTKKRKCNKDWETTDLLSVVAPESTRRQILWAEG